jgi:hypothetical protein
MAGELITQFGPQDLYRETSLGYSLPAQTVLVGNVRGVSFQKLIQSQLKEYYNLTVVVPAAAALATGITIVLQIVDDGQSSADLGLVARFGIQAANLSASGALVDFSSGLGAAEVAGNVTLSATSLNPVLLSIAIANANLNSLAVGNILGLRIRRIGDNAADTCANRVACLGGFVKNT